MRNVELVDQVKVEKHPQNAFQRQAVVDDCVVELVTESREMLDAERVSQFIFCPRKFVKLMEERSGTCTD